MSTTIKASDVNSTVNTVVQDLVKTIVSKHLGVDKDDKSAKPDEDVKYVTHDDLKKFGDDMVESIIKMLKEKTGAEKTDDTKSADSKVADTKSADEKSADSKTDDTKSAGNSAPDESKLTKDDIGEIVKAVLDNVSKANTGKKSYVVNKKGNLVKTVGDDTTTLDVNSMSEEEFANLPKETRQKILADSFRNA